MGAGQQENCTSHVDMMESDVMDFPPLENPVVEKPCRENSHDEEMKGCVEMEESNGLQEAGGFSMGQKDAVQGGGKKKKKKSKKRKLRLRNNLKDKTDYSKCRGEKGKPVEITLDFYLEPRIDASMDASRRDDTLHMYGIDLMGTRDIFAYLNGLNPRNIEWINDSSCNVQLGSKDDLENALKELGEPIRPPVTPKDAEMDESFCMKYLWYRARPFLKGRLCEKVHLMLRMATVDDVKMETGTNASRQLWLKETDEASKMLRKDSKNEHDTSKKDYQQGLKKRQKHTAPHGQKAKKRKLAQKKKATENPDVEKMEVVTENITETKDTGGASVASNTAVPMTSCEMLPPDLRDFIGKLRAEHGLT